MKPPRGARFPAALDRASAAAPPSQRALLRPQRPLAQAAADAQARNVPSGLGLDSLAVRRRMVERLQREGLCTDLVAQALMAVPRHDFVDSALAGQAYEDTSLPIGLGQTISKPSVVARMLSLLAEAPAAKASGRLGRVLEIGTGCGYQTALLMQLASRGVVSVERLGPLHERARDRLAAMRPGFELLLLWGDGRLGHPPRAPYDSIIAAAGGETLPQAWLDQLALGGRLVAPLHDASRGEQSLWVVDRLEDGLHERRLEGVHFVPLKSGTA